MPARPRPRLGQAFEPLEDRALPSTFGVPWADPGHLTLSFVADGTATPTGPSTLSATMSAAGPPAVWQQEILRAFQTWAVNANINLGLVADGGQALGTTGAVQGDARFGDVRVSAAPIASGEVAEASPFTWTGSTFAGDVTFGSAAPFRVGGGALTYDVYSVALHEAGHVFGLDHSTAADSAMNATYADHPGLAATDVANLQALYGARTADDFEGTRGDETLATAAGLKKDATVASRLTADADLTTAGDVDVFKFQAATTAATVTLQAKGLSLLQARVTVYDAAGNAVAAGAAADVFDNDVALNLSGLKTGGTYYVKVQGATADVFGVGAYRLTVDAGGNGKAPPPPKAQPVTDGHTNDTLARATNLAQVAALVPDRRFDATYRGAIEDAADVDYYRVKAPATAVRGAFDLNVIVWSADGALNPRVRVFDAAGNAVAFRVLANEAGLMSVAVTTPAPGASYVIQVSSAVAGGTGGYFLGADFNAAAAPAVREVDNGQVGPAAQAVTDKLTATGGLYQFALYGEPPAAGAGAGGVTLTVTDAAGKVVFTLDATAGDPAVTRSVYLAGGTYALTYTYRGVSGQPAAAVRYHLGALRLSDGVGTYAPLIDPAATTVTAPKPTSPMTVTSPTGTTASVTTTTAIPSPTGTTSTTTYTAPPTTMWFGSWYFF